MDAVDCENEMGMNRLLDFVGSHIPRDQFPSSSMPVHFPGTGNFIPPHQIRIHAIYYLALEIRLNK